MIFLYKLSRIFYYDMKYYSGKMYYLGIYVIENINILWKKWGIYIFYIYIKIYLK